MDSINRIHHEDRREIYLLHIYRRGKGAGQWVGAIEDIAGRKTGKFKSAGELINWLDAAQKNAIRGSKS